MDLAVDMNHRNNQITTSCPLDVVFCVKAWSKAWSYPFRRRDIKGSRNVRARSSCIYSLGDTTEIYICHMQHLVQYCSLVLTRFTLRCLQSTTPSVSSVSLSSCWLRRWKHIKGSISTRWHGAVRCNVRQSLRPSQKRG